MSETAANFLMKKRAKVTSPQRPTTAAAALSSPEGKLAAGGGTGNEKPFSFKINPMGAPAYHSPLASALKRSLSHTAASSARVAASKASPVADSASPSPAKPTPPPPKRVAANVSAPRAIAIDDDSPPPKKAAGATAVVAVDETSAQEARENRRQQLKEAAEVAKRLAVNERTTHRQAEKTAQKASAAKAGHAAAAAVSSSESEDDDLGDDDDDDVLVDTAAKGKGKGTVPLGVQRLIKELERARAKAVCEAKETAANTALTPPQQTSEVFEVDVLPSEEVRGRIEALFAKAALEILSGKGYALQKQKRNTAIFDSDLLRYVIKNARVEQSYMNVGSVRKTAITTRVMELIHQVVKKGIHITKRDLFYTDVNLFKDQRDSDAVLDDVACMVGCTRTSLNVVASDKSLVIGCITFREDGDYIDCSKMGLGGKSIPGLVDKITDIEGTAKFVLLVEKEAVFMRLAEDRFYNRYPCVILTAKGQSDLASRLFLRKIKETLNLPVLGLFDCDPAGLKILSVFMHGSKNMAYDNAALVCPDIKWLGLLPSDIKKYKIPEECLIDMTEADIKTGQDLLSDDCFSSEAMKPWRAELEAMVKSKKKAEIQALSNHYFQYLTERYLPDKLRKGDWL